VDNVRFLQRRLIFTLILILEKKLVKRYIWSVAVYGVATWTIGKVDQKCLGMY
jgi:hypothetical protein